MTAAQDSHDGVPAPAVEGWPGPADETYSANEEEEIAARLEALGYLE